MSFSEGCNQVGSAPFILLEYPDIVQHSNVNSSANLEASLSRGGNAEEAIVGAGLGVEDLRAQVENARTEAAIETERRISTDYEKKLIAVRASVEKLITDFDIQRREYFARIESEVVQLALAIAAKILHREAQVDSMLVATLVRLSLEKMRAGSSITIRVSKGCKDAWCRHFAALQSSIQLEVCEDESLTDQDCIVETELGTANFGLEAQLKEVEQGFFDLLALRPVK